MCRLFGMTAGHRRIRATFWLLDAPNNLDRQSRRNPDGTGLGTFLPDGTPLVEKQPIAAYRDAAFATEARERESSTFLAHVRYATGTPDTPENTHPFLMDGRLLAHNGAIGDLAALERHLGPETMDLVHGQTDSERIFALVTQNIRAGMEPGEAMTSAVRWLAENVPVYAINLILTTPTDLWALRYPETHELWLLDRDGRDELDQCSSEGTRVKSAELSEAPCVLVASEKLDDEPGWRLLPPGTLVHVGPDLVVRESAAMTEQPRTMMHPEIA